MLIQLFKQVNKFYVAYQNDEFKFGVQFSLIPVFVNICKALLKLVHVHWLRHSFL